ncbi:MAG TPA: rhamnulokinase family protein [Chloroflexota bacterium]|nr:rhamnulokinase family protein [Chloroflexota bacterium]
MAEYYLAIDLGAESGRTMVGAFDGDRLSLEEVHRFPNGPVGVPLGRAGADRPAEALYWDVLALWREIKSGIRAAHRVRGVPASIGVDAWGVDYALLGSDGALLGLPYNHRDGRTTGMPELAFERVPRAEIFERTGIQFMAINTLYQLLASTVHHSPALAAAETFLTIPDLFAYWLCGQAVCEFTNATTTQAYDPRAGGWATDLLERLGIRSDILPRVVPPGTTLGGLLQGVAAEMELPAAIPVVAVASHDTGSAVAAVPVVPGTLQAAETFAYVSSGTWSLVGGEVPQPVITSEALAYNFTNEGGVGGFRLLKNVMGLWLVQECRRTWRERGGDLGYDELTRLAEAARPFAALVDPDHAAFLPPGDMPRRLAAYCARTGQAPLDVADKGQVLRCVFESLALKYRWVIERLERLTARRVGTIHVIGGGSQNGLLNQLTADACRRVVVAGPVEATAAGNVVVQAMAAGRIATLDEGRELIRRSFPLATYEPRADASWEEAYGRFQGIMSAGADGPTPP